MADQCPRYIILDFETTDTEPSRGEIIEIGAIEMHGLTCVREFHALLKPSRKIPESISRITGITDELVTNGSSLNAVVGSLQKFIGSNPVVAQNANFERQWFEHHITPLIDSTPVSFFDTLDIFALILPTLSSLSEDSLRAYFNVSKDGAHRALKDCRDLALLLSHAQEHLLQVRPEVASIVKRFLGDSDVNWWWKWMFPLESETLPFEQVLKRQALGDLTSLRERDQKKEGNWADSPKETEIANMLKASAESAPSNVIQFKHRPQQERMAREIASALAVGGKISVEAPTGTGKSIAYLLPGLLSAQKTGVPLVVATHSKALQDQILSKDKPLVESIAQTDNAKVVVVKGQENYFCLRKLFSLGEDIASGKEGNRKTEELWAISYLYSLALSSPTAEVESASFALRKRSEILDQLVKKVGSHSHTTVGGFCPHHAYCRYYNSSRAAHDADIIVANHSLVFNWPSHLPKIRNVVFDEAHHLEDQITDAREMRTGLSTIRIALDEFLTVRNGKSSGSAKHVARLLEEHGSANGPIKEVGPKILVPMFQKIRESLAISEHSLASFFGEKRQWTSPFSELIDIDDHPQKSAIVEVLNNLGESISELSQFLSRNYDYLINKISPTQRGLPEFFTAMRRFSETRRVLLAAVVSEPPQYIRSLIFHPDKGWETTVTPISIAKDNVEELNSFRSVVLTSATLSVPGKPNYLPSRIGLQLSKMPIALSSPFNLRENAKIYFPANLGFDTKDRSHLRALVSTTVSVAKILGGRTLVLICSRERLERACEELERELEGTGIAVIKGTGLAAVERFKENPASVLVGTDRLGEGIDIQGQTLSCVIIEKINERMVMGPLHKRREAAINWGWFEYTFPRRLIWLKQRVGRLVRSETDKGWIIVFDPRFEGFKPRTKQIVVDSMKPLPVKLLPLEQILAEISEEAASVLKEEDEAG